MYYSNSQKKQVHGFHVYPIESWWDSKESLREYSSFQMIYRTINNILRILVGIISYTYFLVTVLWCTLGLFLLPERIGPYSTAIFVVVGNARSIYLYLTNQVESVETRFVEGIRQIIRQRIQKDEWMKKLKVVEEYKEKLKKIKCEEEQESQAQPSTLSKTQDILVMIDDFIRDPNDVLATRLVFKIKDLKTDIKKMDREKIQKMLEDQLNEDATLVFKMRYTTFV